MSAVRLGPLIGKAKRPVAIVPFRNSINAAAKSGTIWSRRAITRCTGWQNRQAVRPPLRVTMIEPDRAHKTITDGDPCPHPRPIQFPSAEQLPH